MKAQDSKRWRLITEDGVTAAYGLAADECLAERVGRGLSEPTLRLYTYRSYCALVGRFQNVWNELYVDFCRNRGIEINRRPTGGGAILMGADQLGVALVLPRSERAVYGRARELMALFSRGLIRGLRAFGIQAEFRRKNDLEVNGRKIAGLGIFRHPRGGLLFHASLLIDMDVPLMLQVLKTPFEKISDKEVSTVEQRIVTVRELSGESDLNRVREQIARGFRQAFQVELFRELFTAGEHKAIDDLIQNKYRTTDWIYRQSSVPDTAGRFSLKTPAGLLEVRVSLSGRMLKAVYIQGDFFASEQLLAELEARLRWQSSAPDHVAGIVRRFYADHGAELNIPQAALLQALQGAIAQSQEPLKTSGDFPYGCFVTPGRDLSDSKAAASIAESRSN